MIHGTLLAVFLSLELVSQTPGRASSWVVVESKDGGFSFSMPGTPREQSTAIPGRNMQAKVKAYSYRSGDTLLLVQQVTLPRPIPPNMVDAQLQAGKRVGSPSPSSSMAEKRISAGNVSGLEVAFVGTTKFDPRERSVKVHTFINGTTHCSLIVLAPPDKPLTAEASRFLDSIRFAGAPASGARPQMRSKSGPIPAGKQAPAKVDLGDRTPEDALRTFLMATAAGDEPTLRAVSLPNRDLGVLLTGQTVPPEQISEMKQMMRTLPIKTLKVGDQVKMPGNRIHVVHGGEVGPDRVVLMPEGAPTYTRVQNINGHWKVDAGPLIAARKAASSARRKAGTN